MKNVNDLLAKIFAPATQAVDTAQAKAEQGFAVIAGELFVIIVILTIIAIRGKR